MAAGRVGAVHGDYHIQANETWWGSKVIDPLTREVVWEDDSGYRSYEDALATARKAVDDLLPGLREQ